jgi:hypothetical protein
MVSQQNHSHRANHTTSVRPLPRASRPRFISLDAFQLTPELIAEIDRAHSIGPGMSGVAYAGGALSGPVSRSTHLESSSLPEESTLGLAYSGERPIPRRPGEGPTAMQCRNTSSCDKDRETWEPRCRGSVEGDPPQRIPTQQPSPKLEVLRTDSPKYSHSLSDPGDHISYNHGDRGLLLVQAAALSPSPPVPRHNPFTEPLRPTPHAVARNPDKSLPIHEDSEEHDTQIRNDNQEQEHDRRAVGECEDRRPAPRHGKEERVPGRQQYAASPPTASSDPVAAYHHGYPHSPMASHSRPGAPLPPTNYSSHNHYVSFASLLVSGMSRANEMKPVLPPYSPVPRADSPYPYPFGHIRRRSYAGAENETMGLSQMDPNVIREQRHLQLQSLRADQWGYGL